MAMKVDQGADPMALPNDVSVYVLRQCFTNFTLVDWLLVIEDDGIATGLGSDNIPMTFSPGHAKSVLAIKSAAL